jgi:hypothetical protein
VRDAPQLDLGCLALAREVQAALLLADARGGAFLEGFLGFYF